MPSIDDLVQKQSLPLHMKVKLTKKRLQEWYDYWGGDVYISFSGGKDSTVLLTIAREVYPNIKAVFCDTGLEFPELKDHVKSFDNVDIIRPKKSFREILDEYGWVFPSKQTAKYLEAAKRGVKYALLMLDGKDYDGNPRPFRDRYTKWKKFINSPFKISDKCCYHMKKSPMDKYTKETGLQPIVATMASESDLRKTGWLKTGCNSYDSKRPCSRPMSFWTDQDVLQYIRENNIKIPSVYGDIVERDGKLYTTGEDRTGCMFCLIGCHLEHGNRRRFIRLKQTHPKIYKYCMEQLGMANILDYIYEACRLKEPLYEKEDILNNSGFCIGVDILPCPLCGEKMEVQERDNFWEIVHSDQKDCMLSLRSDAFTDSTGKERCRQELIKKWQKRKPL